VSACFDLEGIESKPIGEEALVAIRAKHLKTKTIILSYEI
jgi:hypothetical protein